MKFRCTVCGAANETAPDFEVARCLTCGSQVTLVDAFDYRFSREMLASLSQEELVQLAKEAYYVLKITPEVLSLLKIAAPSGDVEIHYLIGLHYFNNKDYAQAIPYLYVAAERMYPDAQCLYAVSKYLQDPDNTDNYPKILKYLTTAQELQSKIYEKIDGGKLFNHISTLSGAKNTTADAPELSVFTGIPETK